MISKPWKDPKSPSNHLPISLLNTFSKIFECLLLTRQNTYSIILICPEQFGLRHHHSTIQQLVNNIISGKSFRRKIAALLLDVQKAFKKVWHPCSIFKLIFLGDPTLITISNFSSKQNIWSPRLLPLSTVVHCICQRSPSLPQSQGRNFCRRHYSLRHQRLQYRCRQ